MPLLICDSYPSIEVVNDENYSDFIKPFDLDKSLAAFIIVDSEAGKSIIYNVHHIISDATTATLINKGLEQALMGKLDDEIDHPKDLNISNENGFTYEEIKLLRNETYYSTNSFSLQIDGRTLKNISIEDWEIVYLSYIPMFKKNNRDEIKCKLLNKTISFLITCSPMHNVDTYINTMIINIYNSDKKKLRFLDEKNNRTLYIPSDTPGEIHYEYKPISSPFAKKKSSSGLSAGAIVAIILSILAVVVAIAAILSCLNRVPHARFAPNKNIQDINIINSTTNINN
jgi:hypothetical protein